MSMALADIDADGDLDLYVANYRSETILDQPQTRFGLRMVDGRPVLASINGVAVTNAESRNRFYLGANGVAREAGEPDVLYRNDGSGRFKAVPFPEAFSNADGSPAQTPFDWGLAVAFRDIRNAPVSRYYYFGFRVATSGEYALGITAQPSVSADGTALSVEAAGAGTLTYQWRLNGAAIAGGSSSQLSTQGLQSGTYTVVVSNGFASVTSVSLVYPPSPIE
jgi:hypothetical protein